jgi:hypothetical protein
MPGKVQIISGPRNASFDHYVQAVLDEGAWEQERDYYGITTPERAEFIRQKLRTAGAHMNPPVAVKAFWRECQGCGLGGAECRYHVKFTVYQKDKARQYKARIQQSASGNRP